MRSPGENLSIFFGGLWQKFDLRGKVYNSVENAKWQIGLPRTLLSVAGTMAVVFPEEFFLIGVVHYSIGSMLFPAQTIGHAVSDAEGTRQLFAILGFFGLFALLIVWATIAMVIANLFRIMRLHHSPWGYLYALPIALVFVEAFDGLIWYWLLMSGGSVSSGMIGVVTLLGKVKLVLVAATLLTALAAIPAAFFVRIR